METIKRNKNAKKSENPRIQELSENQKKIRQDINENKNNESLDELRKKTEPRTENFSQITGKRRN